MYDKDDFPEQQYEQTGTSAMSPVLLTVLVTVVGAIAVLAVWPSA